MKRLMLALAAMMCLSSLTFAQSNASNQARESSERDRHEVHPSDANPLMRERAAFLSK